MLFRRDLLQALKCLVITRRIIKKHVRLKTLRLRKPIVWTDEEIVSTEHVITDLWGQDYFGARTGRRVSHRETEAGRVYYVKGFHRIPRPSNVKYVGLCPFHAENTPSFFVYRRPDKTWGYKCFGCSKHGDVIRFVQEYKGFNFIEAVNYILEVNGKGRSARAHRFNDPKQLSFFDENLEPLL